MKAVEIIGCLEKIREVIIWNEVEDADFEDNNRERIVVSLDDIIERVKNPQDED